MHESLLHEESLDAPVAPGCLAGGCAVGSRTGASRGGDTILGNMGARGPFVAKMCAVSVCRCSIDYCSSKSVPNSVGNVPVLCTRYEVVRKRESEQSDKRHGKRKRKRK